ncbi:hypothetical protein CYMTET_29098 [Cymbomonas tetramitiformis]|uniref:Uncharacterized protein n=1 Tax=Cymbomonas tetramitiformis TaxID=36881 RepID=A0AAE0FLY8_9CHLO|nr:hypothetical protein CYMTET_29098 [Cymbomonas tetramitiformis]
MMKDPVFLEVVQSPATIVRLKDIHALWHPDSVALYGRACNLQGQIEVQAGIASRCRTAQFGDLSVLETPDERQHRKTLEEENHHRSISTRRRTPSKSSRVKSLEMLTYHAPEQIISRWAKYQETKAQALQSGENDDDSGRGNIFNKIDEGEGDVDQTSAQQLKRSVVNAAITAFKFPPTFTKKLIELVGSNAEHGVLIFQGLLFYIAPMLSDEETEIRAQKWKCSVEGLKEEIRSTATTRTMSAVEADTYVQQRLEEIGRLMAQAEQERIFGEELYSNATRAIHRMILESSLDLSANRPPVSEGS